MCSNDPIRRREIFPALPGAGPIPGSPPTPTLEQSHPLSTEVTMTQLAPTPTRLDSPTDRPSRTLWRVAGGLAIAHVVLLFAGFSQEVSVTHDTSLTKLQDTYGGADMTRVFTGGYVEAMSFLVLVPALVLLARLLGRRTEVGRVAAETFLGIGIAYVAATLAVGFAPGAAAIYAAHHDVPVGTIALVNDIRNYSFVLQVAMTCAMMLALGVAALADKSFVKWVGWCGVVLGAIGIVVTPFAQNPISMVWVVWLVGIGVLALRGGPAED